MNALVALMIFLMIFDKLFRDEIQIVRYDIEEECRRYEHDVRYYHCQSVDHYADVDHFQPEN